MTWLLSFCCCLLLIHTSGAQLLSQVPRFLGHLPGRNITMQCLLAERRSSKVRWFRLDQFDDLLEEGQEVTEGPRVFMWTNNRSQDASKSFLKVLQLQEDDSGVYFCSVDHMWGSGTELRVAKPVNWKLRSYRTQVKDGLIILQGLLLASCVTALMLRKRTLLEESDSVYEEPEMDHIYEGLTIETCGGGGLYEELSLYTQPQTTEAPWQ